MSDLDQGQTPSTPISVLSKAERARIAREALVGKTVANRYILRSLLGHGGMGAVYEAEHLGIGKKVAIKFVDSEWVSDEQIVTRFAREARAMSAIESPHIVTIFDAGTEEGRPYLVMELLRGEDLGQRLRRTVRVPLAESLHIIAMVLKGLSKAHAAGIVHRDLKPDNIFLVEDHGAVFAKIVDFGVSKIERPKNRTSPLALTGRGTVLGTPFYMSPEQAQAMSDLDGRADLFSVGTILFECLSGRPPHTGETYEQIILSICMNDAPKLRAIIPSVPESVSAFVAKALARERTDRFESAEAMLAALHELSPDERKLVPIETPAQPIVTASMTAPSTPIKIAAPAPSMISPLASSDIDIQPAGVPKRSSSAIMATAAIALLLGIAATFAAISALGKKDVPAPAPAVSTAAVVPSATASIAPVVSVSASASAPRPVLKPKPTIAPPAPKPASSKLDINRDLP